MRTTSSRFDARALGRGAVALAALLMAASAAPAGPKFYPDDPIWRDPETQDAPRVQPIDLSDQLRLRRELVPRRRRARRRRAVNVNTLDEVPDSTWFTNRIGRRPMTTAEVVKGPGYGHGPGGRAVDDRVRQDRRRAAGTDDPGRQPARSTSSSSIRPSNPEMASGAEVIATKFLHAVGYHVPENYLATVRPRGAGRLARRRRSPKTAASGRCGRWDVDDGARARRRATRTAPTASWPARRSTARRSGRSATTARGPTIRTTSSRTSIAASCAG